MEHEDGRIPYFHQSCLWKVIVNGDSVIRVASANTGAEAIPDEHLLKFLACKDAKSLWEAIKNRFGGNKELKKMQKTILKHNYENFAASSQAGLDKTYDRFQKLISQLEIYDTLSMDDLYNNLKVYKSKIKGQSSLSSNSQKVAFVSLNNSSSTNETVNTAHSVSVARSKNQASTASYIDADDLNEMDLKWQVAMLTMRVKRFVKKTERKLDLNSKDTVGFDRTKSFQDEEGLTNFALMAYTSQGSSSSKSEVHIGSKVCLKSYEALQKQYDQQREALNKSNLEIIGYQMGLESLEARIVVYEKNEAVYEEDIAFLKYDLQVKDTSIKEQISTKDRTGLGYDGQTNESDLNDIHVNESKVLDNVVDSMFDSYESDDNQVNNRLDNHVFKSKVSETITIVSKIETNSSKTSKDSLEKSKTIRSSASLIEEWESDSEDENVFKPKEVKKIVKPSFKKNYFVNARNTTVENKYKAKKPWKFSQSPRALTKSGQVPVNAAKQSSHRATTSVSASSVVFTNTECVVLSLDFKLLDESQVLLKVPKNNNMYSFDLKNVVLLGGLTCLFAYATLDESNLWHRRLGHINFKTMNKLVRRNFVRCLPSKLFENNHTCVACQKRKQHKASYKTKTVSSICKPLQLLHMDLFGPVSIRSINKKTYCLVVTDDFSRFSWVFILATKDKTPEILKNIIAGIENQIDHKVKTIRWDKRTEFKNRIINKFCQMKGIRREFNVPRTPQQNGVAERKNRKLIEAAKTMLADSKLPITFSGQAVNTTCYVKNGVLVIKPHNKTPYELFLGTKANIDAGQARKKTVPGPQYVLLPLLTFASLGPKSSEDEVADDAGKKKDTADLQDTGIFSGTYDDEVEGVVADYYNLELPIVVIQAFIDPSWIEAMQDKLLQFRFQKFWKLVDLPKGKHAIGTKWVYRNKKDERGIIVRNNVRLVAQGHTQEEGIDYDKVFAPVVWIEAIRIDAQVLNEFYKGAHFLIRIVVKTASTLIETNKALLKDEKLRMWMFTYTYQ
nr:putative ribonuclease H-like domain-containing protein [Tanacetum cinerariifolium]